MRKKAIIIHINAFVRVTPLVGGYLKAFALADADVRNQWEIELYSAPTSVPAAKIIADMADRCPDLIAFSVYMWNAGLVRRLLPALQGVLAPTTRYLLGGVEVMHHAHDFLPQPWDGLAVCNGEGERTFRDYLLEASDSRPDFGNVKGLSIFGDGDWQTTEPHARIRDLNEIPSPWLNDMFEPHELEGVALFETNRGCPYSCEYCYWGGAIGAKINRLNTDRVLEEFSYLARHGTKFVFIVDANFGILPADIEIAEHIAALHAKYRRPERVTYNTAKNNFERVEKIAKILVTAGVSNEQTISLQTLNERALKLAKRDNIKSDTYLRLQRRLNEWGMPSIIELIWPLPGETLDSFKDGIDTLCGKGAQAFSVYPLLWLNNAGYGLHTGELGVVTLDSGDPVDTGKVVIQTKEVRHHEYVQGVLFATALLLLHDCRGFYLTLQMLNALGVCRFRDVLDAFVRWMGDQHEGEIAEIWRGAKDHFENSYRLFNLRGDLGQTALHGARKDADRLFVSFFEAHPEWLAGANRPHARLLRATLEFDLLNRPYIFAETPLEVGVELQLLTKADQKRGIWVVESPFDFPCIMGELRTSGTISKAALEPASYRYTMNHRKGLIMRLPSKTEEEHTWHCTAITREMSIIEARYEAVSEKGSSGAIAAAQ